MKIIDLLNKIANGNIPKRIIYDEYVYIWNNKIKNYEREIDIDTTLNWDYIAINCLNEPVEILDDEDEGKSKVPIKLYGLEMLDEDMSHEIAIAKQRYNNGRIRTKINEIIDYLEKQSKGE